MLIKRPFLDFKPYVSHFLPLDCETLVVPTETCKVGHEEFHPPPRESCRWSRRAGRRWTWKVRRGDWSGTSVGYVRIYIYIYVFYNMEK